MKIGAEIQQSICSAIGEVNIVEPKGEFFYRDGITTLGSGSLYALDGSFVRSIKITLSDDKHGYAEFEIDEDF